MSYALSPDESAPRGLRRIADEQAARALEGLERAAGDPDAAYDAIHDARKRFKKVRAVLRLVRKPLGDVYHRENRAWRDAGRRLSTVRESAVAPRTVAALLDRYDSLVDEAAFRPFIERLETRHGELLEGSLGPGEALEQARDMARAARERISAWPIPDDAFDGIADSLEKVYRRGRNRMADAYDDPSGPRYHEWRKRAKYLWYHHRLLAPGWPDVLGPWADAQHHLTDLLGEANDLSDLLHLLESKPELLPADGVAEVLSGPAKGARDDLWQAARPLGLRLYSEQPGAFVARFRSYRDGTRPIDPDDVLLGI